VMELLQGVPLETAMRRQTPPMLVREFVSVMVDVGRALAAAHKSGVIHRDLKPTNIFLHMIRESVAVPKVLDFGISKFLEEQQDHALTIAGTVLGSPLYMSPEQANGTSGLDGRTDIFAFGAILFEAVCGFRPYDAPNFNALIVAIATRAPKSIHEHAPTMPESLRQLVHDCLVTDRDKRIGSFDEVVDRLIGVLPELETSELRLPMHETALLDPEATSALPLVRASEGPPPAPKAAGVHLSSPPMYSNGLGGTSPGGLTGDRDAITVSRKPTLLYGAGGAGAAALVVCVALLAFRGRPSEPGAGATVTTKGPTLATDVAVTKPPPGSPGPLGDTPKPAATTTAIELPATPSTEGTPPVVDIDSLPQVANRAPAIPSGMGRISVAATPGSCTVAVDGVNRGVTPISSMELSAGPHQLACRTASGKTKNMMVIVPDGATNKVKLSLD
jgi:hypothetical protein